MPKEQLKAQRCQSCGICIGEGFMEAFPYQIGGFTICGWCGGKLRARGHIELDDRRHVKGQGTLCRWLYPDGTTRTMRVLLTREPQFLPLDVPLPKEFLIATEDETEEE